MCSLRGPRAAIREPQYAHSYIWDETNLLGFREFCMSSARSFPRGGGRVDVVEVSRLRVSRLHAYASPVEKKIARDAL